MLPGVPAVLVVLVRRQLCLLKACLPPSPPLTRQWRQAWWWWWWWSSQCSQRPTLHGIMHGGKPQFGEVKETGTSAHACSHLTGFMTFRPIPKPSPCPPSSPLFKPSHAQDHTSLRLSSPAAVQAQGRTEQQQQQEVGDSGHDGAGHGGLGAGGHCARQVGDVACRRQERLERFG